MKTNGTNRKFIIFLKLKAKRIKKIKQKTKRKINQNQNKLNKAINKTKKQKKCHLLGPHGLNTTRNPMGQDSGPWKAQ